MKRINELVEENIRSHLRERIIKKEEMERIVDKVYRRKLNPYNIANKIARKIIKTRK